MKEQSPDINELELLNQKLKEAIYRLIRGGLSDQESAKLKSETNELKKQLDKKIKETKLKLDPYELQLRNDLAKNFGFKFVGRFGEEALAVVETANNGFGYINRNGEIIKAGFDEAKKFQNGVGIVTDNKLSYLINSNGYAVSSLYKNISDPSDGIYAASKKDSTNMCYLLPNGKESRSFSGCLPFYEGLAAVKEIPFTSYQRKVRNGDWSFVDKDFNFHFGDKQFKEVRSFGEGLAAVKTSIGWRFIDKKGHYQLPARKNFFGKRVRYIDAESFSEGLCAVRIDSNNFVFIDKNENVVIDKKGIVATIPFKKGLTTITYEGPFGLKSCFIDKTGKTIISDDEFRLFTTFRDGVLWLIDRHTLRYSLIDRNKNLLLSDNFDEVKNFEDGVARVRKGDVNYYINKAGKKVF